MGIFKIPGEESGLLIIDLPGMRFFPIFVHLKKVP
jgi:hypothetical protein